MSLQETATFQVDIRLSTEQGEIPTDVEVERLVADQMSGVLDEDTGLQAIAVFGIRRVLPPLPSAERDDMYYARALRDYQDLKAARDKSDDDEERERLTEQMETIEREIFA